MKVPKFVEKGEAFDIVIGMLLMFSFMAIIRIIAEYLY